MGVGVVPHALIGPGFVRRAPHLVNQDVYIEISDIG